MHHVGIVLLLLWLLSYFDRCHPAAYFISLIYLYSVCILKFNVNLFVFNCDLNDQWVNLCF